MLYFKKPNLLTQIIYVVANVFIVIGFVLPYLLSAKSDILVILGLILMVVDGIHIAKLSINIFKQIKNEKKN